MHEDDLINILADIVNGYSLVKINNQDAYIKHLTLRFELNCNSIYKKYYNQYKLSGLPTIQEKLKFLEEDGDWTKEDQTFIDNNSKYLENLLKTKSKLFLNSQIEEISKTISEIKSKLDEKVNKKNYLIGVTCENYAEKKKVEYQIFKSIYKDETCLNHFFTEEDLDYVDENIIEEVYKNYYSVTSNFSEENLKKISLMPIFYNFYSLTEKENPYQVFNKNVLDLSFFQQKLLHYSQNIRYALEASMDIPSNVKDDYDSLINFVTKGSQKKNKSNKSNAGYSMVGADKDEMKSAGIDTSNAISPFDILKKSGKSSLNKKDFLNIIE